MLDATLDELRKMWLVELDKLHEKMGEIELVRARDGDRVSSKQRLVLQDYWAINARILEMFIVAKNKFDEILTPFPSDILQRISRHCEELSSGIVDANIENSRSIGGGRPMKRWEREKISRAVFYLEDVKSGKIECSAPVATVAQCFNVTKQAVRSWRNRSEEIWRGISRPHENLIEESMRHAGIHYSAKGRGAPSA